MHELSITQSMIEICEQNAGGKPVLAVIVEIGLLSGVVPEAVEFCFESCSRDTLLDGARLLIEQIPGQGRCNDCNSAFPLETLYDPCNACGSHRIMITAGNELRVKELEVA